MTSEDPDINYLIKVVAKDQAISEPAAWNIIRNKWTPNSQLAGILTPENSNMHQNISSTLIENKQSVSLEKMRQDFELRKLEMEEKRELRDQRKIDFEEKKLVVEKEIALAKILSEKEINTARIEHEKEIAASRIEMEQKHLAQKVDFDQKLLLIQANKTGTGDMFEQINQVNKLEQTFSDRMIARAEALGVDAATLKKITGSSKSEGFNFNKLLDLAAPFIETAGKKQQEIQNIPSGLEKSQQIQSSQEPPQQQNQGPTSEQIAQQREYERRIAAEQERIKTEVIKKQEENAKLQAQLDQEKHTFAQRQQLEDRAIQLGIAINPTMTDRQISDLIVRQEFIYEQGRAQRDKLDAHAISIGITPDPSWTNETLFDMIEDREAEIGQSRAEGLKKEQEVLNEQKEQAEREKLISRALDLGIPFNRDISNSHLRELVGKWEKDSEYTPAATADEPEALPVVLAVAVPEPTPTKQKQKKPRKEKAAQVAKKELKDLKTFTVLMDDQERTFIKELKAKSPRSAALLIAKNFKGSLDNPVRIIIKLPDDSEKIFDTWLSERAGKNGSIFLPRAKEVKKAKENEEIQPEEIKIENIEVIKEEVQPEE